MNLENLIASLKDVVKDLQRWSAYHEDEFQKEINKLSNDAEKLENEISG